jgi:hypothetical protein
LADCQLSEPKPVRATAACHVENESEPAMIVEPHEVRRLAERMRRNWVDQGIPVNPGLSVSDIETFESRHEIHLPEDFKIYLGVVNGMARVTMDKDMFMFIPLQDLSVWDGKFTFADWCIESAIFFMAVDTAGAPFSPILRNEIRVADSFGGFVKIYLSDPASLGPLGN